MASAVTIECGEVLDISMAANFYNQLKAVSDDSEVNIKDADLVRIDASCLQVLIAFSQYAADHNITINWQPGTDVVKEAAQLIGVKELIKFS